MMQMTPEGRQYLTEAFEGCELRAYQDSTGVWTIGYGHTAMSGMPIPHEGLIITKADADVILARDLFSREETVLRLVKVKLSPRQFDALVDFVFNEGEENFARSSVLVRLNESQSALAADLLPEWDRAGGRVLPGLLRRREAERRWFLSQGASA